MPNSNFEATTNEAQKKTQEANIGDIMLGVDRKVAFEAALEERLRYQMDSRQIEERNKTLVEHGIAIASNALPPRLNLASLNDEEWNVAAKSDSPMLTFHAINYLKNQEIYDQDKRYSDGEKAYNEARLRSLPLVHGTTEAGLMAILGRGAFVSNRTLYEESGKSGLDFADSGIGWTTSGDRELGLDNYIFADFARPHMYHSQNEITIVIDPSVINQPGAFATEKDIMDANGLEDYAQSAVTPEYFYQAAQKRLAHSVSSDIDVGRERQVQYGTPDKLANGENFDPTNMGSYAFSTWEFKLPEVSSSAIRKLVIRDEATFQRLREQLGTQFEITYEPELKPGNMQSTLEIPGKFDDEYQKLVDADYAQRQSQLSYIPDDQKETVVIAMPYNDPEAKAEARKVTEKSNPNWYFRADAEYPTYADMIDDIKNTPYTDPFSFGVLSKHGKDPWFNNGRQFGNKGVNTDSGKCVAVVVERSKADHNVCVIREVDSVDPSKI